MADRGFNPEEILWVFEAHDVRYVLIGGLAAALHGSPYVTTKVEITPDRDPKNLRRLAEALNHLHARIRKEGEPEGAPLDSISDASAFGSVLHLMTRAGDLDVVLQPPGTQGYDDVQRHALRIDIHGISVPLASLADVIRSKEAGGREGDRLILPTLRRLLERLEGGRG